MALGQNPLPPSRFFAPGDRLGRYELVRQIAVGGMAELYLARTIGLEGFEKLVCVKRILPQFAQSQSFVTMFLNEARLAATLHHPNIAQVFDIGHEGASYFMSMEYVHGEDLGRLLAAATERGLPIGLDGALTLVVGLCAGLHYAHEKLGPDGAPLHVVHGDVSPSNVLVSYEGAVKLVDFGIARAAGRASTTARGGLRGKIAYMSPEHCRGLQTPDPSGAAPRPVALDRRSDIFSAGAILYELTTGRQPFVDETEYGILNQIASKDVRPPSQLVPGYPPSLEAIVLRALARDPDQRYRTAQELQGHLEDFAHAHRLRITPLVLSRYMATLFPARVEEWNSAQTQGAFFVEQHVVRTLVESGKTGESLPAYVEPPLMGEEAPTQIRGGASMPPRATSSPAARGTPMPPSAASSGGAPRMGTPALGTPRPPVVPASGPRPLPTHQAKPDYVADHTELVRPVKPRRAKPDRPDLAVRAKPPTSWKLPVIAGSIGIIGLAIALATFTRGGDGPSEEPPKSIVDVAEAPASLTPPPVAVAVAPPVVATPPPVASPPPATTAPVAPPAPVELEATPPPTIVEPAPPPVVVADVAAKEPAAAPRPKRPTTRKTAPTTKADKKPAKVEEAPSSPKIDTSKPWSKDSPFMPVRPVKKSR